MKKKALYFVLFGVLTVVFFIGAGYYLDMALYASPGDFCECMCEDDALNHCDYMCRYHGGCMGTMYCYGKCDLSATSCNNTYELLCEDGLRKDFVCSEICEDCDHTFWQR